MKFLEISNILLPWVVLFSGIFILIKLKFFMFAHPLRCAGILYSGMMGEKRGSAWRAVFLSLAGTLGVGNIVGVAAAIYVGGAGAVLWMWISGLICMTVKYAEVTLAADFKDVSGYGSIGYIDRGNRRGVLGCLFAVLLILSSFTVGGAIQSGAVVRSIRDTVGISEAFGVAVFVILAFLITVCGKIGDATFFIIPFTSAAYILLCLFIIGKNVHMMPSVISEIFSDAFTYRSSAGGVSGFFLSKAIREGFSKGILSNEAGMGTSPMAHTQSEESNPCAQGMMGAFEVFFDTHILCSITAFAILSGGGAEYEDGMLSVLKVFRGEAGNFASWTLSLCIFSFALATVLCWSYYGEKSVGYLVGDGKRHSEITEKIFRSVYYSVFFLSLAAGGFISQRLLFSMTDVFSLAMVSINIYALIKNADRLKSLSAEKGLIRKCGCVISLRRQKRRDV